MIKFLRFSSATVALGYVAVSLIVLAAFATPLWYAWRETVEEERAHILVADTHRLEAIFLEHGVAALKSAIDVQVGTKAKGAEDLILFADGARRRIAGNLQQWPAAVENESGVRNFSIDVDGQGTRVAMLHVALPGGYHLLVANNIEKYRQLENLFMFGLALSAGIVVLLGIVGGSLVRRTLLSKVKDINEAASAIMKGDFSHRLPHYSGENELNTLVATENRMLDQIEQLIGSVSNVSNSIAHDLRTPLAELRSRLEELLLTRPDPDHVLDEVEGAIADVDRVIAIFNALLRLADIDTGVRRAGFVEIDVAKVAEEVAEFYQPLAESQNRHLVFASSGPLAMQGDPLLLTQAIGNLVDNAIKFSPVNGTVSIAASRDASGAIRVAVADDGPGIPDGEKDKVLDRFYRGDTSRGTPGVGLGLSLVAAVAKLHRGSIGLTDNHPGVKVSLHLGA